MAFIDDLGKAVSIFNDGVQRAETTAAFTRATDEIEQINSQMTDGLNKRNALVGASQQLAQDLLQAGAPTSRIQAAFQAFGAKPLISPEEQIQVGVEQRDIGAITQGQEIQKKQTQVAFDRKLALKKLATTKTLDLPERKFVNKLFNDFTKDNKASIDALNKVNSTVRLLKSSNDPAAVNVAVITFLKLAGESGRLSDEDFKRAIPGSGSTVREILRKGKVEFTQKSLTRDRTALINMMTILAKGVREKTIEQAKSFSKQRSPLSIFTQDELSSAIITALPRIGSSKQRDKSGATGDFGTGFKLIFKE